MLHLTPMMGKSDTSYWKYQEFDSKTFTKVTLKSIFTKNYFGLCGLCIYTFHPDTGVEGF